MSLPKLELDTNKNLTSILGVTVRQTEKGGLLEAAFLNAQQEPYDLTNKKVTFMDHKENDKFVADDKVTIVDARNGSIQYTLHPQTYAGTGTAWFEINDMDGNKVDSTQSFTITVDEGMGVSVYNTNYVPALERLRDQMQNLIDQAQKIEDDQTNKFTQDLTNNLKNAQTQLNTKLTSMQQAYDNLENQRTSAFNTSQVDRQNTFNQSEKSRSDTYTQDKTKRDADWTADKKRIDDEWTTDKARIDGEWTSQKSSIQSSADKQHTDIGTAWDDKKKSIDSEWQTKKATLDSTIADLSKKLSDIQTSLTDLSDTKLPAMNKYADDVQKKVTQLKADFNAIDFSSYATKTDLQNLDIKLTGQTYDKDTIDQKVRAAGKVKKVCNVEPDEDGNVPLTATVINGYDIATNNPTKQNWSINQAWYVDQTALRPFADAINQLKGRQTLNSPDFNSINETGIYLISNTAQSKNAPSSHWGTLLVLNGVSENTQRISQLFISDDSNNAYFRSKSSTNVWHPWKELANSADLTNVRNLVSNNKSAIDALQAKTNVAAPLFRRITTNNNWQDILGVPNSNQILVSIRDDTHGGNTLGANSAGIAFGGGDTKGVLNVSYSNHTARIIGGNGNAPVWHEDIAWRSDIANVNNRLNELNAKMPDIHVVNSEAEGNTYLASHPNAIIMVKG